MKSGQRPGEHYWWEQYRNFNKTGEQGGSFEARNEQNPRDESRQECKESEQDGNGVSNEKQRDEGRTGDAAGLTLLTRYKCKYTPSMFSSISPTLLSLIVSR
jgi:hypothetical protein